MFFRSIVAVAALALTALPLTAQSARSELGPDTLIGVLGSAQSQTLAYHHASLGFKVLADVQWHDWLGLDMRGTAIMFDDSNHTYALEAGPRVARWCGPVEPYATVLVGALHQFYYGASLGGALGANVHLSHEFYWGSEAAYRYAMQPSTPTVNPVMGRFEMSTGIMLRINRIPLGH